MRATSSLIRSKEAVAEAMVDDMASIRAETKAAE
jgi:hypothetical protein